MRLIKQSSDIWGKCPTNAADTIEWIERAGRVCYRSEDKIVPGSGEVFVNNIFKRKHFSVLEHSNIVIRTKQSSLFPVQSLIREKSVFDSNFFNYTIYKDRIYIAGNWRAWYEWCMSVNMDAKIKMFSDLYTMFDTNIYEIVTEDIPQKIDNFTVEFITNRAVTHELVRHRPSSYSQESQRYVRYNNIDFILPVWYDSVDDNVRSGFKGSCQCAQDDYQWMIEQGMKAQEARHILPNATATKIVMTASLPEWWHVFNLRCSKAADPQMQEIMKPVKDLFIENDWTL